MYLKKTTTEAIKHMQLQHAITQDNLEKYLQIWSCSFKYFCFFNAANF